LLLLLLWLGACSCPALQLPEQRLSRGRGRLVRRHWPTAAASSRRCHHRLLLLLGQELRWWRHVALLLEHLQQLAA
jgi:hypothetical protein